MEHPVIKELECFGERIRRDERFECLFCGRDVADGFVDSFLRLFCDEDCRENYYDTEKEISK